MTAHVISLPDPEPASDPRGPWLKLSAAFTDAVADLADREDLTVSCAPGKGRGAPGCFIPDLACVELDGTYLGHAPDTCDPSRPSDRERYAALWGVLVHEAAHASHTRWSPAKGVPAAHMTAALVLEESRIEAAHLRRRPADRRWLRASASRLVLADFAAPASGRPSAPMTPWSASQAAGLLLARADIGILSHDETRSLATTITSILGSGRLSALTALWRTAHGTADEDQATMIDLGRRWCRIVGVDPARSTPKPPNDPSGTSGAPSPLAEAIGTTLAKVESADKASASSDPSRTDEEKTRDAAKRAGRRVFGPTHADTGRGGPTAIKGSRSPLPKEQAAARRLARQLRAAAHRERTTTTSTSPTPPGRLQMRAALAADAQRAAGSLPTAEPFVRTTRRHVPAPPLRLGIACDVSGSMMALAEPVASAAWILARAAAHVPDAQAAAVIFGAKVRPVLHPGQAPARVPRFSARDMTEQFVEAVDSLDAALDLSRPGAARLLVVVSDGIFTTKQREIGQQRIARLGAAGCGVLWLALDRTAHPMTGSHLVALSDPAEAAQIIGAAASRALSRA